MSEKISYIYPEDLANLERDADGNYIVPEGFEIYKVPTKADKMANVQAEIDRIEAMVEPTDAELIAWAKENHDYYTQVNFVLPIRYADLEYYKNLE
jgi:hypothetical protein